MDIDRIVSIFCNMTGLTRDYAKSLLERIAKIPVEPTFKQAMQLLDCMFQMSLLDHLGEDGIRAAMQQGLIDATVDENGEFMFRLSKEGRRVFYGGSDV